MNEEPNFEEYSYETLLEVYDQIDAEQYPDRKAKVAGLLEERKGSDEAREVHERREFSSRYSTFGPRFFAAIIDGISISIILYALGSVLGIFPEWIVEMVNYLTFFDLYIYSVLLHGLFGRTIGKAVMSVKVVKHSDESDISFKQAFLRDSVPISLLVLILILLVLAPVGEDGTMSIVVLYLLMIAGFLNFIWVLLEIFTMLLNEKRRALHDIIAGTVVINT